MKKEIWLSRDQAGDLWIHEDKPRLKTDMGESFYTSSFEVMTDRNGFFQHVTVESSPVKYTIEENV